MTFLNYVIIARKTLDNLESQQTQVPWNKSSTSTYSDGTKKEHPASVPKYDSSYGRSRPESRKPEDDKSTSSRITSKYTSPYNSGYQRDISTGYGGRTESSRIKPVLDKKDTSHPPVTYRPVSRTGARSRDPSPVEKTEKSSSSSSSSYNRLYPRPYQRSVSRERTDSTSSLSTIPKYTGRSSTRDEPPKYGSSLTKDDIPRYMGRSSSSKDERLSPSRYNLGTRTASREDLTSVSQKYINSRFLPKNTVEKSFTAYTRPSTVRSNETSRKNRELLSVLHAQQEQERLSRPASRCSSVTPEDITSKDSSIEEKKNQSSPKQIEMETVTVITRGTSPTPTTQHSSTFLRSRRVEVAKLIEKKICRPKKAIHTMVDKEIQSDRLDDTTKISRYAGASRISATPWSSFLDMKFSSPNSKQKIQGKTDNHNTDSSKSLSRASSTKSLDQSCSKSDKLREVKKSPSPSGKSKIATPKQISDKKQLPPPIPKNESSSKSSSLHSLAHANKDFRKSVLNMNPDGTKKVGRRSNSASSADSDNADPDTTDISENLATCKSYHNSSSSKLPQKASVEKVHRNRRSPSSEVSTSNTTSGSEDDSKSKKEKRKDRNKSAGSSRTSIVLSSGDELSTDKSPKPPQSPRLKIESSKSEAEAKSFLMRALAPVTNLFKVKHSDSPEKINSDTNIECGYEEKNRESPTNVVSILEPKTAKIIIHRVESGEKPWWLDEESEKSNSNQEGHGISLGICQNELKKHNGSGDEHWWIDEPSQNSSMEKSSSHSIKNVDKGSLMKKPFIRHVESGELPWWLDENSEIPEGLNTCPNAVREDGTTADGKVIYKIRNNESDESSWWLSSSENTNTDSNKNKPNIMDAEYLEKHQIRHIDSGERLWWLSSSDNIPNMVQAKEHIKNEPKYAIKHQDIDEKPWWWQHSSADEKKESENESEHEPLGDRASPEGLEMPKDDEGRKSPYDNIPSTHPKSSSALKKTSFISKYTNIDEILGGSTQLWSPLMDKIYGYEKGEKFTEVDPEQVIIHEGTPHQSHIQTSRLENLSGFPKDFSSHKKLLNMPHIIGGETSSEFSNLMRSEPGDSFSSYNSGRGSIRT